MVRVGRLAYMGVVMGCFYPVVLCHSLAIMVSALRLLKPHPTGLPFDKLSAQCLCEWFLFVVSYVVEE